MIIQKQNHHKALYLKAKTMIFYLFNYKTREDYIIIQVLVDDSVIGSVIGKNGIIANAIRTIVQASAYANGLKKVKINIDSF